MSNNDIDIKGKTVDNETRCVHYHSPLDIIAIKFKCCSNYYPCYYCHQEETSHNTEVWAKNEFDTKAVLCGICKMEMTITEYINSSYTCPSCYGKFNSKCSNHYHYYFEV